jgi:hypothetical protein
VNNNKPYLKLTLEFVVPPMWKVGTRESTYLDGFRRRTIRSFAKIVTYSAVACSQHIADVCSSRMAENT